MISSCNDQRGGSQAHHRRANVLWILLDTARTDLSAYGYSRPTSPNIDQLANRGVLFENNYSQATLTPLSVPSYMSGRYFAEQCIGIPGQFLDYREVRLPARDEKLIPEIFRENGYDTAMVTKKNVWFSLHNRLPRAFDKFFGVESSQGAPSPTFEELNSVLIPYLSQPRERPFFLYVHAWDMHFPHNPEPPYDRWIDKTFDSSHIPNVPTLGALDTGVVFDERDRDYLRSVYDGSLLYTDAQIGRLFSVLDELNLTENTLILISADHGEALAEDSRTVGHASLKTFDEVTHVPLIMAGPGLPQGVRVHDFTENVDILPTLVALLNLNTGAKADGVDLLRLLHRDIDASSRQRP